jgi:hypothetical protein
MILPLRLKDGVSVIDTRRSSFLAIDFFSFECTHTTVRDESK